MKRYRSVGGTCFDVANTIFLVLLTIVMLYPLVNVLAISFSSKSAIDAGLVTWRPHGFNVSGYQYMLRDAELIHSYGWTIAYALGGTALTLTFTSLIAYPLSQPQFVLKKGITLILSITMFISGGMIPTFILLKQLNMFNTYWVMVLPGCVSAYNTFVFRSFFQGIPASWGKIRLRPARIRGRQLCGVGVPAHAQQRRLAGSRMDDGYFRPVLHQVPHGQELHQLVHLWLSVL